MRSKRKVATPIGFDDILEHAVLHLDMPNLTGHLEFSG